MDKELIVCSTFETQLSFNIHSLGKTRGKLDLAECSNCSHSHRPSHVLETMLSALYSVSHTL